MAVYNTAGGVARVIDIGRLMLPTLPPRNRRQELPRPEERGIGKGRLTEMRFGEFGKTETQSKWDDGIENNTDLSIVLTSLTIQIPLPSKRCLNLPPQAGAGAAGRTNVIFPRAQFPTRPISIPPPRRATVGDGRRDCRLQQRTHGLVMTPQADFLTLADGKRTTYELARDYEQAGVAFRDGLFMTTEFETRDQVIAAMLSRTSV